MAFPPTLYLIGAQKSGTTTLAHLLSHHPQICLATGKEAGFFTHNFDKGMDWYRTLFENPESEWLLDASVTYAQADLDGSEDAGLTPRRIHGVAPQARFVYLLRNPGERLYSAYLHFSRSGRESRSFDEVLDDPGNYFFTSDYAGQVQPYLDYFERDAFLFLKTEDLASDPDALLRQVYDFLGLPAIELPPALLAAHTNSGYVLTPTGKLLWKVLGSRDKFNSLVGGVKTLIPPPLRPWIARVIARDPDALSPAQQQRLDAMFAQPIGAIEKLSGLDLSGWRS